jgi:hypothetical protein
MEPVPHPSAQALFDHLIAAVRANDRAAFLDGATAAMARSVTPTLMDFIHGDLFRRFDGGYRVSYLREVADPPYVVHLWQVMFDDGSEDIVLRVVTEDGQLAGFWRHDA